MSELFAVPLISKNGVRGKILTSSRLLDDTPEKLVIFESGREVSIANRHLTLRNDGTYYLDLTVDPRPAEVSAAPNPAASTVVIPRIEETAVITRRTVETGRVRVSKSVSETPFTIDEPIIHEEYTIQRIPINRVVTETEGSRVEGDITIVPVYEEETITTKRLILREEIHLTKNRREERSPRTILLRKEVVEVKRIPFAPPRD